MAWSTTKKLAAGTVVGALTLGVGAAAWAQADDAPQPRLGGPAGGAAAERAEQARSVFRFLRRPAGGTVTVQRDGDWEDVTFARGTLEAVDASTLTVTRADGDQVTFTVDDDTRYRGVDGLDELRTGAAIVVWGPAGEPADQVLQPDEEQEQRMQERRTKIEERRANRADDGSGQGGNGNGSGGGPGNGSGNGSGNGNGA